MSRSTAPVRTVTVGGLMARDSIAAGVTVTAPVPATPANVAETVALPTPVVVSSPVGPTFATVGFELDQVAMVVTSSVEPSEKTAVAPNWLPVRAATTPGCR